MANILDRLQSGELIVADGAMGSMLMQRGLGPGECPELLNVTKPEIPEEVAKLYYEAGADIVQTNTFGGSPMKLAEYNLADRTEELNSAAVKIVQQATGGNVFISGSCGPSGKLLKPFGDTKPDDLYNGFQRQIGALIEAGAHIICIETMIDLQEALLAVKAARSISDQVPVMATMTFDKTPKGFFTMMGVTIKDAVTGLTDAGASILGSNCGNGIENMITIAQEFRAFTDLPLLIQANAGMPEMHNGKLGYPETPDFFAEKTPELIAAGVSIIGGCCGSTPEHIKAVRIAVDSYKKE